MDKLKMHSKNIVSENIEKISKLFPNCITENASGKIIDFDSLKQELSADLIEGNKERYRIEWPGKKEAITIANLPINKTLRPIKEDSKNFGETENIYIEGDNLEVLKLLQESYLQKIKIIYIDPPYNTGNDFVYNDKFARDESEELFDSGQEDEYNQRLVVNPEISGRYHSDWLSMIYPRLKLARNLLKEDGVIFISIDDNEQANLVKMCDEIFGEQNFLACISRKTKLTSNKGSQFSPSHEYILAYAKNVFVINEFNDIAAQKSEKYQALFKHTDEAGKYNEVSLYMPALKGDRPSRYYIDCPDGSKVIPPGNRFWRWSETTFNKNKNENRVIFKETDTSPLVNENGVQAKWNIYTKIYLHERLEAGLRPGTFITDWPNSIASKEFIKMGIPFPYAKPWQLIKYLIEISDLKSESIILDFFSGSSSTAEAVMQMNCSDGGKRKFIMVQLPEATDEGSEAFKSGFNNICEIGKERIRRAGKKIKEETNADIDYGFRVYRLDDSNMKDVYYHPQDYDQSKLDMFEDNVKSDRTADDLLTQIMLDWGLPLDLKIEELNISGKQVYKVDNDSLYACFDKGLDESFTKEIAKFKPLRIVFRDNSFKDNSAKTNVKQLLKQLSPETEMKVI
jgi:adenine-specific DNA-methyltransferase